MRFFPAFTATALVCLGASSLITASPVPNPQQPTATVSPTELSEASPTAAPDGVPVVLPWYPQGGPLAPSIPPASYQILGEGGTETTLYYAGPGYSIAGTSFVPVTQVVTDIVVLGPSQFEAYNLVSDAAIGFECSLNNLNSNRANCIGRIRTNANAQPVVQTVSNIPGVPTTIYAQPTTLPSPVQLPDLSSGAEAVVFPKSALMVGLAAVAVIVLV